METMFTFLLHASAGIILFYLVYWLFLRKETFYTANRWFLILALFSAVLLPLFPLQYSVLIEAENTRSSIQTISDTFKNIPVFLEQEETISFSWSQGILLIYLTGAVIFLLRLLSQTAILFRLMVKYRIKSLNGIRVVENEKYGLPFSFFNIVFINPKFHTQDDLPEILAHEKVHIRENHWFDLLFIELLTVIFWFNPFIWLFERSIKQNHEYLADKGVLAQGHTVGKYQAILVNQLMGMQIIGITNNLNFALSTNRLKMMTKKKTPMIKRAKFAWILPIVALLLFAFAKPEYKYAEVETIETNFSPELVKGKKVLTIHGKVLHQNTKEPLPGASVVIKGTSIGTVSDRDGTFKLVDTNPKEDGKDGSLNTELVISFVGLKTVVSTIGASGAAKNNAKFTVKMQDEIIGIALAETFIAKSNKEEMAPPPPPPLPSNSGKPVFYVVEDMPQYPGGSDALNNYAYKMQKKIASSKNIKGKAKVMFTVDTKGKIADIKVVEKDNDGAAKGAYIIAKSMEDWNPGKQRGKAVSVKFLLPVEFK